ncbi:unnamed protein product [Citrullus colocynthis]|uniref:Uncharacterized protein n=1 Tax=Citrullus colocynthis TaxID=252529 RepID=A0ABP0Y5A1_9ROSI
MLVLNGMPHGYISLVSDTCIVENVSNSLGSSKSHIGKKLVSEYGQRPYKAINVRLSKPGSRAVSRERTILSPFTKEYRVLAAISGIRLFLLGPSFRIGPYNTILKIFNFDNFSSLSKTVW